MRSFDLSPTKDDFYTQLNNELSPGVTCKPTSTVTALALAGWPVDRIPGAHAQPEDNLTALCRSPEGEAVMLALDPALKGTPPNEVWGVIAWAVNEVAFPTDRPLLGPRWDWDFREVLFGISRGIPFAASTWLTKSGHVVPIVGYETEQDAAPAQWREVELGMVKAIIIDDPYGDRTSGAYDTSKSGYHNRYDLATWRTVWRSTGVQIRRKGGA